LDKKYKQLLKKHQCVVKILYILEEPNTILRSSKLLYEKTTIVGPFAILFSPNQFLRAQIVNTRRFSGRVGDA
jgi:hypothetical protein